MAKSNSRKKSLFGFRVPKNWSVTWQERHGPARAESRLITFYLHTGSREGRNGDKAINPQSPYPVKYFFPQDSTSLRLTNLLQQRHQLEAKCQNT